MKFSTCKISGYKRSFSVNIVSRLKIFLLVMTISKRHIDCNNTLFLKAVHIIYTKYVL